jgi:penicillin-binding protein 2
MLVLDPLRRANPQIKLLAGVIFGGLGVLLIGLWWLQVVKRKEFQSSLETQSYKTMRIPATRGRIMDRQGELLAETRPSYNLNLYLEEVRPRFGEMYDLLKPQVVASLQAQQEAYQARVQRELTPAELRRFKLRGALKLDLEKSARYLATSNLVAQVASTLRTSLTLDPDKFHKHYQIRRALPMAIVTDMSPAQLARFTESNRPWPGLEVEVQPIRIYPHGELAAHVIGQLTPNNDSAVGEEAFYTYRLPDYRGVVGVEYGYDTALRGQAGAKSVLVNNFGYRFEDAVWMPAEPGQNVTLTLDLRLQQAAEAALQRVATTPKGAVVVLDVNNGDILAMASSPSYDPNQYIDGMSHEEYTWLNNEEFRPQINRATQENYAPGSIFKPVIGLACLEAGLDPKRKIVVQPHPRHAGGSVFYVGKRAIADTAPPGDYDFKRALKLSSNSYFISNGLWTGIDRILALGKRLHLGETTGLKTRQETSGIFPDDRRLALGWSPGDTANLCIGQGYIAVTPLQMTVMTAAIANGGNVLWPRLVKSITDADPANPAPMPSTAPSGVRDRLEVRPESLKVLKEAMLADVEDADGTGRAAAISSVRICGKTGTAQITDLNNRVVGHTTWFISFAPYENPRVAVVIMVEGGSSGGGTCAPLARDIYRVLFPEAAGEVARNH